ncbi:MAG: hypothetical protein IPK58_19600 [Acidobacteria bacterium]|nr:hypothetical protein [Acidobacteriota bacterium]
MRWHIAPQNGQIRTVPPYDFGQSLQKTLAQVSQTKNACDSGCIEQACGRSEKTGEANGAAAAGDWLKGDVCGSMRLTLKPDVAGLSKAFVGGADRAGIASTMFVRYGSAVFRTG